MKISHNWLQKYFERPIPDARKLAELFTFHSFEIEGVEELKNEKGEVIDFVIDAKILPDRAHYCLSHRGIAGEVSVLTGEEIVIDSIVGKTLKVSTKIEPSINTVPAITIQNRDNNVNNNTNHNSNSDTRFCRRYIGRYVENISFGKTPEWMKKLLKAIGQRPISGIVDATNFCMFDIGQPLHAFDADKVKGGIVVRPAKKGEKIVLIDGIEICLTSDDSIIADNDGPIAIAGVKGGKRAEIDQSTKRVIIESANFEPTAVRRTSTKYGLRGESSKRYENEITPELTIQGMNNVCVLIQEMNPDAKFGPIVDEYPVKVKQTMIEIRLEYIEERLGVKVPLDQAKNILERMGIIVNVSIDEQAFVADTFPPTALSRSALLRPSPRSVDSIDCSSKNDWKLTIPFNRLDLTIHEDIVEEVGRIYGYEHIKGILLPKMEKPIEILPIYYLTEIIRDNLVKQGFSEVSLYTLVEKGDIETAKPLAKDKAFARKNLADGMMICLKKNALNADLLGLQTIKIFEVGKVFSNEGERYALSLGVAQVKKMKSIKSEQILADSLETLKKKTGLQSADSIIDLKIVTKGIQSVCEIDLEEVLKSAELSGYFDNASYNDLNYTPASSNRYKKISLYPFIVRDIAIFVPESIHVGNVWRSIEKGIENAGALKLLVRHSLFDTFKKDGKVSFAFRMVFQSMECTLTDAEINSIMEKIYEVIKDERWEVR